VYPILLNTLLRRRSNAPASSRDCVAGIAFYRNLLLLAAAGDGLSSPYPQTLRWLGALAYSLTTFAPVCLPKRHTPQVAGPSARTLLPPVELRRSSPVVLVFHTGVEHEAVCRDGSDVMFVPELLAAGGISGRERRINGQVLMGAGPAICCWAHRRALLLTVPRNE